MKADHMTDSELDGLCEALTHQRQIDEDGTEVGVSRQAVDMAIAAIKELRERVAMVEAERDALQKKMGENFCGYIENIAALKKDAERYRWLREAPKIVGAESKAVAAVDATDDYGAILYGRYLDAAIDAVRGTK